MTQQESKVFFNGYIFGFSTAMLIATLIGYLAR